MRKFMLLLLLAGAAVPSAAMARPNHGSDENRPEQSDRSEQQQQQSNDNNDNHGQRDRSDGNNERQHFSGHNRSNDGNQSPAQVQMKSSGGQSNESRREHFGGYQQSGSDSGQANESNRQRFGGYQNGGGGQNEAVQKTYGDNSSGSGSNWRSHERRPVIQEQADDQQGWATARQRGSDGSLRQYDRAPPNVMRNRVPVVSDVPREGTQPRLRTAQQYSRHDGNHWNGRWDGNWRNDRRYNWQERRHRHRSLFRLGLYFDPFGWGYQRYSIGWRLWPSYYSSNYWFNPVQYGLPYAPPGYQWVRYYDDALLVDTWSGQVVDVIYNFFW
jgi:hypothetical protein